jgi:hypothetical protein
VNGVTDLFWSSVSAGGQASVEGDLEGVQRGLNRPGESGDLLV